MSDGPEIVPCFSEVDAKAAVAFHAAAFGLVTVQAFDGPDGKPMHGEMRHGGGVIMLGSVDDPPARHRPGVYLVAPDVDAHFVRAAVAGTGIVYPPEDTEFGARRYRTRDPEGHEWNFDSYRPSLEASHWTPEA